jgi:hypothetical protein
MPYFLRSNGETCVTGGAHGSVVLAALEGKEKTVDLSLLWMHERWTSDAVFRRDGQLFSSSDDG